MIQNIIVTIMAIIFIASSIQILIRIHKSVENEIDNKEFYQWQYNQYLEWKSKQDI